MENLLLDGESVLLPKGECKNGGHQNARLGIQRRAEANVVTVEVAGLFKIVARVVPITPHESRVHGYDVTEENCFVLLETYLQVSLPKFSSNGGIETDLHTELLQSSEDGSTNANHGSCREVRPFTSLCNRLCSLELLPLIQ
ncbi:hypothetical protein FRX31_016546 [Thalictrum thalictroides]|uniref:Uncharacterized protein n=1 Tax=Thalictrum thalictroides TaxID=46969 RepID=A0A7J6WB85_THATH|nr:hypothetical protein FRX31_016546 [Thalictrum thalictroides]